MGRITPERYRGVIWCVRVKSGAFVAVRNGFAFPTGNSGFPKSHNQHGDWEGWGTALKPAWEPIALARKPLCGTVAANLAAWGVGALNVDGCRVGDEERFNPSASKNEIYGQFKGAEDCGRAAIGRWPANIVHDGSDEVLACFPVTGSNGTPKEATRTEGSVWNIGGERSSVPGGATYNDQGSAARFFYCAKASRKDRDEGLAAFDTKMVDVLAGHRSRRMEEVKRPDGAPPAVGKNTHPTVKPTSLMQWLCRLVTPPGGTILDPFMGSGSTGKAALLEGFRFIGCEREDEYMPIAQARIAAALRTEEQRPVVAQAQQAANENVPQLSLFSEAA